MLYDWGILFSITNTGYEPKEFTSSHILARAEK